MPSSPAERFHPLAVKAQRGRHGAPYDGDAPVRLGVRHPLSIVTIMARRDKGEAAAAAVQKNYGIALPGPGKSGSGTDICFQWCGDNQYYAVAAGMGEGVLYRELKAALDGVASVSDQSHGRVVIRISGPKARHVLAKGSPVDWHPRAFPVGAVAVTQMAHVGVHAQRSAGDQYDLSLFRGFSESFWEWLTEQAQEFGYEIE
jgi:sarcosine oxidase subunit gamma